MFVYFVFNIVKKFNTRRPTSYDPRSRVLKEVRERFTTIEEPKRHAFVSEKAIRQKEYINIFFNSNCYL